MIDEKIKDGLKVFLHRLNDTEVENLAWHLEHETPVCCGIRGAAYFLDGNGGG